MYERKVHLFPIVPINTDIEICRQYSDILKDKLQMTEIFTLFEVQDFSFEPGQFKNIIFSLKDAVTKTCKNKNINSAIYGTIEKKNSLLFVNIYLYTSDGNNIIASFSDKIYNSSDINRSAKDCAVHIGTEVSSIKGTKVFFSSALCPGLGHFLMKKKFRGAAYMGLFAFFVYKYSSAGKLRTPENTFEMLTVESGFTGAERTVSAWYYINGEEVSFREYNERYQNEVVPVLEYNDKVKSRKNKFKLALAGIYLVSLLDTIFSSNEYEIKSRLEEKVSFDVDPFGRKPSINFNYHF